MCQYFTLSRYTFWDLSGRILVNFDTYYMAESKEFVNGASSEKTEPWWFSEWPSHNEGSSSCEIQQNKTVLDGKRCRDVRGPIHTENGTASRSVDEDCRGTICTQDILELFSKFLHSQFFQVIMIWKFF